MPACVCLCVYVWGGWRVSVMGTCASAYRFIHPLKSRPAQAQIQLLQVMLLYLYLYRCTLVSVYQHLYYLFICICVSLFMSVHFSQCLPEHPVSQYFCTSVNLTQHSFCTSVLVSVLYHLGTLLP